MSRSLTAFKKFSIRPVIFPLCSKMQVNLIVDSRDGDRKDEKLAMQ